MARMGPVSLLDELQRTATVRSDDGIMRSKCHKQVKDKHNFVRWHKVSLPERVRSLASLPVAPAPDSPLLARRKLSSSTSVPGASACSKCPL